jgi:hypothetical protein
MHGKRLVPMPAIAALAGILVLCGCSSAAPATSPPGSMAATAPASGRPAGRQASTSGGLVHVTGYSDNDGPKSTVILTGEIGDFGQAVRASADGTPSSTIGWTWCFPVVRSN